MGPYTYRIERKGTESQYSVTDGTATVTMPIRWAMGASSAIGQTFILEKDGELYESRVSWFRELEGLGPTMGSSGSIPADITAAAGRLMSGDDKRRCFGCHATHAVEGKQLTLEKLMRDDLKSKHAALIERIETTKDLSKEDEAALLAAIRAFKKAGGY